MVLCSPQGSTCMPDARCSGHGASCPRRKAKRRSGGEILQVEGGRSRMLLVSADSVSLEEYKHVLGGQKLAYAVKPSRHQEESIFFVEGLSFPDASFSGLVSFHVTLLESPEKVTP